jgi:CheY-like chemotaxis protein
VAKILVVDDIKDNVKLISFDLEDMGHVVLAAYSGQEALQRAEHDKPDCILLDVMMPVMDGFEVCRRLKSNLELRHISVIMISAGNTDEDIIAGLDAGADDLNDL